MPHLLVEGCCRRGWGLQNSLAEVAPEIPKAHALVLRKRKPVDLGREEGEGGGKR